MSVSVGLQELLVPPINFAMVCPGVYRSGYPTRKNYPFLRALRLRSILYLCPEDYAESNLKFCEESGIAVLRFPTEGNKEPFNDIAEPLMHRILSAICDVRNLPMLIHCNKGKHRTGTVVAALRLLQAWSLVSIFAEYKRFAEDKARVSDQQYVELYYPIVRVTPAYVPAWFCATSRVTVVHSEQALLEAEARQLGHSLLAPSPPPAAAAVASASPPPPSASPSSPQPTTATAAAAASSPVAAVVATTPLTNAAMSPTASTAHAPATPAVVVAAASSPSTAATNNNNNTAATTMATVATAAATMPTVATVAAAAITSPASPRTVSGKPMDASTATLMHASMHSSPLSLQPHHAQQSPHPYATSSLPLRTSSSTATATTSSMRAAVTNSDASGATPQQPHARASLSATTAVEHANSSSSSNSDGGGGGVATTSSSCEHTHAPAITSNNNNNNSKSTGAASASVSAQQQQQQQQEMQPTTPSRLHVVSAPSVSSNSSTDGSITRSVDKHVSVARSRAATQGNHSSNSKTATTTTTLRAAHKTIHRRHKTTTHGNSNNDATAAAAPSVGVAAEDDSAKDAMVSVL